MLLSPLKGSAFKPPIMTNFAPSAKPSKLLSLLNIIALPKSNIICPQTDFILVASAVTIFFSINSQTLKQEIDKLTSEQLQQVADYIAFLKFRDRHKIVLDSSNLASLATEFAEEDRALADAGMNDYKAMLHREDKL